MQRRFDSNNNRIRIQIDRSVEVRKQKSSHISPQLSDHNISPKIYKQLKLPSIKQSRSPSARNQKSYVVNPPQNQHQTNDLLKKLSYNSVKQNHHRFSTENRRKSSLSQNKLEPQSKFNSKRTRSISNMVSKNSLIVSTQYDEEEDTTKQIKLSTNLPEKQIKIEIVDKVRNNFHQIPAKRYTKSNVYYSEETHETEKREVNSLRHSIFQIIENSRLQRNHYYQYGNTDQQLLLLEQLYKQNEQLVKNFVQIRQEAQQLDHRVKTLSNQRKQFRIQ